MFSNDLHGQVVTWCKVSNILAFRDNVIEDFFPLVLSGTQSVKLGNCWPVNNWNRSAKNSLWFLLICYFNINIPIYFSRAGIKGLFVLMPILGVGWILGLFAVNKNTIVFEYAFAIINGLQVDLKTIVYLFHFYFCWTNSLIPTCI